MKRLYLVRHAETAWNRQNRLQGHSDLPLSPLGERQAQRVGTFFASHHLHAVFTSGLTRSLQTARAIASGNGHGVAPIIEQGLAEMHLGAWEGLTPDEIDGRFGGAYQEWGVRPASVVIPGAELIGDFRRRVRSAFERIVASLADGESVAVSHGGVIAAILADFVGATYEEVLRRVRLDNAGITACEFSTRPPHVAWINATGHLDALEAGEPVAEWP